MVVLSAAVTTKNGKALLARQYVDMSRIRIEGLLAAFPKLLGTENKQHTFVETESVRYIYQPIESLYLLLITNKASNIVEDLETLRMLSKIVPDIAGGISEEKISSRCFELIFAFDEVLTVGGMRENITFPQVKDNLEMDSHDERLHNMIQESKREAAKDEAARKASEMRAKQRAMQAAGIGSSMSGMQGIGGSMSSFSGGGSGDYNSYTGTNSSYGTGFGSIAASDPYGYGTQTASLSSVSQPAASKSTKGMKLGINSVKGKNSMIDSLMAEENIKPISSNIGTKEAILPETVATPAATQNYPVSLVIEEKLSAKLSREGTLEQLDIKGSLALTANVENASKCRIHLGSAAPPAGLAFQTHPKINRAMYDNSRLLCLKDEGKGFPVGRPVGVLRWSLAGTDESLVPLTLNCWPEDEGGGMFNVSLEYTLGSCSSELHNVEFIVPLGSSAQPRVTSADGGTYAHDPSTSSLLWRIELMDKGALSLQFKGGKQIRSFLYT